MSNDPLNEDLELSWKDNAEMLFFRQETDTDVNVITLTTYQCMLLKNILDQQLVELKQ